MRIEYTNTFADFLRFNAAHQVRSIPLQVMHVIAAAMMFWAIATLGYFRAGLVAGIAFYLALWILQFVFNAFYFFSRHNDRLKAKTAISLQDDGVSVESRYGRALYFWPGVIKAVERAGLVAIYVTPHMALIIPRRAFGAESERQAFLEMTRNRIAGAAS